MLQNRGEKGFNFKDDDLCLFTQLGLTRRQAQIYLANAQLGQTAAKAIAKKAQADRAEIYRALIKLEKLGLIQRCLTRPLTFRAAPITTAFSILLQRNAEKHEQIEAEAKKFIENFREQNNAKPREEGTHYRVTFGKNAEIREYLRDEEETQTSVDSIFDWKLSLSIIKRYPDIIMKSLERGVKSRQIAHISEDEEMPRIIQTLMKTGSLEIKSASIVPKVGITIRDKKMVAIVVLSDSSLNGIEVFRSKNPAIVKLLQDYFNMKWQVATTPSWHKKSHQMKMPLMQS